MKTHVHIHLGRRSRDAALSSGVSAAELLSKLEASPYGWVNRSTAIELARTAVKYASEPSGESARKNALRYYNEKFGR